MKKLIEITKNWKHRNLLHISGGCLIALLPNLLFNGFLGLLLGCWSCALIGHLWEMEQVRSFKARYSKNDILLAIIGGLITGSLFML